MSTGDRAEAGSTRPTKKTGDTSGEPDTGNGGDGRTAAGARKPARTRRSTAANTAGAKSTTPPGNTARSSGTAKSTAARKTTAARKGTGVQKSGTQKSAGTRAATDRRRDTADPAGATPDTEPLPEDRFGNRDLSWLDFNSRVLALAQDPDLPLLERLRFLAIFATNLDEFYMVRVAGLKRRLNMGLPVRYPDGLSTRDQLARISAGTQELVHEHARCFAEDIRPALEAEGIRVVHWDDIHGPERTRLSAYFREQVFPVLTPLAVDPAHPFPYISGLSLNLAVTVYEPRSTTPRFARVKVPNNVPRLVTVADRRDDLAPSVEQHTFLPLEDLIAAHLDQLFPGMRVVDHHLFRITRNAELEVEEDRDEDLLQALERELARRRFGPAVRLEVTDTMAPHVLELLVRELGINPVDVLAVPGLLDLAALGEIYDVDRPDLKYEPFVPATHRRLVEGETPKSVFATLREGDLLVHHPYDSFATSVQRFIEQAALDPNVLAIKQTLYRTSGDSPIVDALTDAAEAGKQVVVLVEIKARFDEQANITWARTLERAGCHVVYGLVGLKTHCKTALIVRQEGDSIRRYCHIGTGNYNPKTARLYEDLGLLTADPDIGADLTDLFNVLTGYSRQTSYRTLLVSPYGVRQGIVERVAREVEHARAGRPAGVRIKVNSLVDEQVIDSLYRASRAGVRVELAVRGICSLRPGVPGLSEHIRVRSIVGRFLEHSRMFRFENGGEPEFWLGSADLMHRNLDRRVEVLVRVTDEDARRHLDVMLDNAMAPDVSCWELSADGTWVEHPGERDYQTALIRHRTARSE